MSWDYRVVRQKGITGTGDPWEWFSIREVYYGESGTVEAHTKNPCRPGGETLDELRQDLEHMLRALNEPVLEDE